MALADRLGIGRSQLAGVIEGEPLDAPIADAKLHKTDRRDYAPEFPLERTLKNADLALRAEGGADLPLLAALSRRWHAARTETTQIYLHADMTIKEQALARVQQPGTAPGRYRPPDSLLAFLDNL